MLAKVISGANVGLLSTPVTVEVDIASQGLPSFTIVGLADRAIEEAKERVRSAIKNSQADFPAKKITINLAPADLKKEGPLYDLPIALGLLLASEQLVADLSDTLILGELSLDGTLRMTHGVLPLTLLAKSLNLKRIFVPMENAQEAAVVEGIEVYPFSCLKDVFAFLVGQLEVLPHQTTVITLDEDQYLGYDFKDVKGQESAKRALEIAAAGGHNILMKGPPGSGKTLLARSFPTILPLLTKDEALEVTKLYSISGNLPPNTALITTRPFRTPHHSASSIGIIGGGNNIRPGEISLAHRGVLFTDELAEFPRHVLESLRQPLEDKVVTISRATGSLTFPAQFILVAACNPCPCGFLNSLQKQCICMPGQIIKYKKKLSGPLLDRIDIHVDVPFVDVDKLTGTTESESSKEVRGRVDKARQLQLKRLSKFNLFTNSEMGSSQIKQFCQLNEESLALLKSAIAQMHLSGRGYSRILKLARTIADLEDSENIQTHHIMESLQYRAKEG